MSQVVTLRFPVMPPQKTLLEGWNARGSVRRISPTTVELSAVDSADSVIVDYGAEESEVLVQGAFCETTWAWVKDVRAQHRATFSEDELGPDEKTARFDWQRLPWYGKALAIVGTIVLLPLLLPLCLLYALRQLARLAFMLKKKK